MEIEIQREDEHEEDQKCEEIPSLVRGKEVEETALEPKDQNLSETSVGRGEGRERRNSPTRMVEEEMKRLHDFAVLWKDFGTDPAAEKRKKTCQWILERLA